MRQTLQYVGFPLVNRFRVGSPSGRGIFADTSAWGTSTRAGRHGLLVARCTKAGGRFGHTTGERSNRSKR
ncbi:hypothetical protein OK006_9801 [Actinobacteria bacterium OK006]|nr:hypothetical protein OK006_9801 [Actinobacteria bacterium OK006]